MSDILSREQVERRFPVGSVVYSLTNPNRPWLVSAISETGLLQDAHSGTWASAEPHQTALWPEITTLRAQLEAMTAERDSWRRVLEKMTGERDRLLAERERLQKVVEVAQRLVDAFEDDHRSMEDGHPLYPATCIKCAALVSWDAAIADAQQERT